MNLTDQQKKYIKDILDSDYFKETLYKGLEDKTKRDELGQFYTPADVCITMIEMYKTEEFSGKNILDPCCGSGNLLIAMLAAGADSDKLYGNDYDEAAVKICRTRINAAIDKLNEWNAYGLNDRKHIEDWQIHHGNALISECLTEFDENYDETILKELLRRRTGCHGGYMNNPDAWEQYKKDNKNYSKERTEREQVAVAVNVAAKEGTAMQASKSELAKYEQGSIF